jgi:biotin carboxyl carrier protein
MKLKITVHGVAYEVDVEVLDATDEMKQSDAPLPQVPREASSRPASGPAVPPPPVAGPQRGPAATGGGVVSPIAGTVLEIKCKAGEQVGRGQDLVVIEAMKMETAISAPAAGTIKQVLVAAGDSVRENQMLVEMD